MRKEWENKRREEDTRVVTNTLQTNVVKDVFDPTLYVEHIYRNLYALRGIHPIIFVKIDNIHYRCHQYSFSDRGNHVVETIDLAKKTRLHFDNFDYYIVARNGQFVYLCRVKYDHWGNSSHLPGIYEWDTNRSCNTSELPLFHDMKMNVDEPLRTKPFRYGRWDYVCEMDVTGFTIIIVYNLRGDIICSFKTLRNNKIIYVFRVCAQTGLLIVEDKQNSRIEYDLTEIERLRVDALEPILSDDHLRNKILSFLVLEEKWAWSRRRS
jgi:hypothetical protein